MGVAIRALELAAAGGRVALQWVDDASEAMGPSRFLERLQSPPCAGGVPEALVAAERAAGSLRDAATMAVVAGGETNVRAMIACAAVGAAHGVRVIRTDLIERLPGAACVRSLADRLVERRLSMRTNN